MLDKCAVAGDITQALDRRGVWTCAITVIGGTSSTAVKLQSCETASGSFTDFKTLIPASEARTDQYKGFVVDLHGAGKFIKVVGATMATAVFGDCDHDIKSVPIKAGEVPSGADLEDNKTATIDVSDYTEPVEIEPSEDYDGMKKATVTLSNIPSGGANAYCWSLVIGANTVKEYLNIDTAPETTSGNDILIIDGDHDVGFGILTLMKEGDVYTKISNTSFSLSWVEDGETVTGTYTRDSTKDITLWQLSE